MCQNLHVKKVEQVPFDFWFGGLWIGHTPEILTSTLAEVSSGFLGEISESFSFPGQFVPICPFVLGFYPQDAK